MPARKVLRTIILGTIFAVLAIVWLAEEFDLDRDVLLEFLLASAIFVGACAALAAILVAIFKMLRS